MRIVSLATKSVDKSSQVYKNQNKSAPNFKCAISGLIFDKANSTHLKASMSQIGDVLSTEMGCDINTQIRGDYNVILRIPQNPQVRQVAKHLVTMLNSFADENGIDASFKFIS